LLALPRRDDLEELLVRGGHFLEEGLDRTGDVTSGSLDTGRRRR